MVTMRLYLVLTTAACFLATVYCQYQICYNCGGISEINPESEALTEEECLTMTNSTDVAVVDYNTETSACTVYDTINDTYFSDSPPGRWQARSSNITDCQNFTMEEIPFASVNNSMYDTTFTSMAECFWSCFGLQNCFALSYDTTTACTRYTSCANDTCVIMGSKNSTVYLRHCNNECPPLFDTDIYKVTTPNGRTRDKRAYYECIEGYIMTSESNNRSCMSQTLRWRDEPPTCELVDCGDPPTDLQNGYANFSTTTYLSVVNYFCNTGYMLSGATSTVCNASGLWNDTKPFCISEDCVMAYVNGLDDLYGIADGDCCGDGFILDCTLNISAGTSTDMQLRCVKVDCGPVPEIEDGNSTLVSDPSTADRVLYICLAGYYISGTDVRYCQSNGSWNGTDPVCLLKDCGQPSSIENGTVTFNTTTYGQSVVYSCDVGYQLIGTETMYCNQTGEWDGTLPACTLTDCGALSDPSNGAVILVTSTTYPSYAYYECDLGYTLSYTVTRACQLNGTWSYFAPVCDQSACSVLSNPMNGEVFMPSGTNFGATAYYQCDEGYILSHSYNRTCEQILMFGYWSGYAPICYNIDCEVLNNPLNGQVFMLNGTDVGAVAYYQCDDGYTLSHPFNLTCLSIGYWSYIEPYCSRSGCDLLSNISNGRAFMPNGTHTGAEAYYQCNSGYMLSHIFNRSCQIEGYWSYFAPTCYEIDGSQPTNSLATTATETDAISLSPTTKSSIITNITSTVLSHSTPVVTSPSASYLTTAQMSVMSTQQTTPASLLPTSSALGTSSMEASESATGFQSSLSSSVSTLSMSTQYTAYSSTAGYLTTPLVTTVTSRFPSSFLTTETTLATSTQSTTSTTGIFSSSSPSASTLDTSSGGASSPSTSLATSTTSLSSAIINTATNNFPSHSSGFSAPDSTTNGYELTTRSTHVSTLTTTVPSTDPSSSSTTSTTMTQSVTNTSSQQNDDTSGVNTTAYQTSPYTSVLTTSTFISSTFSSSSTSSPYTANQSATTKYLPRIYIMACTCNVNHSFENLTHSEIIAMLVQNTAIDRRKTSSSIFRLKSRQDTRVSSAVFGCVGLTIIASPVVVILLNDFVNRIVVKRKNKIQNHCKRETE